jgi:hypothetical protein
LEIILPQLEIGCLHVLKLVGDHCPVAVETSHDKLVDMADETYGVLLVAAYNGIDVYLSAF